MKFVRGVGRFQCRKWLPLRDAPIRIFGRLCSIFYRSKIN